MKLVLCFLFSLYAALDFWWIRPFIDHPVVALIIATVSALLGYHCGEAFPLIWYTPDEITMIVLLFLLLYHLHPRSRKFSFLLDANFLPLMLLISMNEFGFGMLAGLKKTPFWAFPLFTLFLHWCFLLLKVALRIIFLLDEVL